jgi:hypothetical protein
MRIVSRAFAPVVLGFGYLFPGPANAELATVKPGLEATDMVSMSVMNLRDEYYCGGSSTAGNQDAKNLKFAGCVMYVLGVVDMLREWQNIDPSRSVRVCVPRNVTSGQLIIVVQDYIEAKAPWREGQNDATTAVIGALKAKWPCSDRRR